MQVDAFGDRTLEPALALTLTLANDDVQNKIPADLLLNVSMKRE
jgi:hypothetical protein